MEIQGVRERGVEREVVAGGCVLHSPIIDVIVLGFRKRTLLCVILCRVAGVKYAVIDRLSVQL